MLESRLAAFDGTKWMGAVRVNAMPAHCPRAASIGGYREQVARQAATVAEALSLQTMG